MERDTVQAVNRDCFQGPVAVQGKREKLGGKGNRGKEEKSEGWNTDDGQGPWEAEGAVISTPVLAE